MTRNANPQATAHEVSTIKEANFSTASKAVVVDTTGMTSEQIAFLKAAVAKGVKSDKPIIYMY